MESIFRKINKVVLQLELEGEEFQIFREADIIAKLL
jgi:hypothetical protein